MSMMDRPSRSLTVSVVLLLLIPSLALCGLGALNESPIGEVKAADYSFSVERQEVNVTVLRDGSVDIDYYFLFTNVGYLDGVDIGLPNRYYDPGTAGAIIMVNNVEHAPSQIQESPYIDVGMAVEFGGDLQGIIEEEGAFELYFHVNNPHMVYENELLNDTVGVSFRPTWFDPDIQVGTTHELVQRLIFPEAFVNDSLALWYESNPWDQIYWDNVTERHVAMWTGTDVGPDSIAAGNYDVGIGFPKEYVEQYFLLDPEMDLFGDIWALVSLFLPLVFMAFFVTMAIGVSVASARKRRGDYYEPKMNVVGAGPRRDLTVVEAAVVLERPLETVSTMVLFGLIRKGKVQVLSEQAPMRLQKLADAGEHQYETDYLSSIGPDGTVSRGLLKITLVNLINATLEKMKGFEQSATQRYYESICDKA